ncbi:DNA alkylation repair protein [Paracoccus alcaliphilus]|uniref:DNA alkylation repair protein n=1 Tax=Paracoccus alcaliphilus TaxID=34002 RepID=UPI003B846F57
MRQRDTHDTFHICAMLVDEPHEYVRKAMGSWLRTAGNVNPDGLIAFLDKHASPGNGPVRTWCRADGMVFWISECPAPVWLVVRLRVHLQRRSGSWISVSERRSGKQETAENGSRRSATDSGDAGL